MDEQHIEHEIKDKGLDAPRVKPEDIDELIADVKYHVIDDKVTVCIMTLTSGFTVTGESAVVSVDNFDPALGRKISNKNARAKIWPLAAYALQEKIHQQTQSLLSRVVEHQSPYYQVAVTVAPDIWLHVWVTEDTHHVTPGSQYEFLSDAAQQQVYTAAVDAVKAHKS